MVFDHWEINNRLEELGWRKYQIPYFKKGLVDSIQGHWNDKIINYTHDFDSWYCDDYAEPKLKHGPVTWREKAYTAGYESGEEFIKQWAKNSLNITWDSIFGD